MDSVPWPFADEQLELLQLDIDLRLHGVMLWALTEVAASSALVAGFLRMAYLAGYQDALSEPLSGQLFRDHGYRAPPKPPEARGG